MYDAFGSLWPWFWRVGLPLGVFAASAVAILALYFLKLRRQPLEVPSTFLWRRTIEDLHVNSFWQRLRQNLLLFLQLLLVLLLFLTWLNPGCRATKLTGDRFIFLIDTSASMGATDVEPTRLDEAKRRIGEMLDEMRGGDVAMLVSFSDAARVEQTFTDNRRQLRRALAEIQPTERTSDLSEALRAAAGLANPGRYGDKSAGDVGAAEALPATLYIFSDGGFNSVPQFQLGNLSPVYVPLGVKQPDNLGITTFRAERNPDKPEKLQAFARVENFSAAEVEVGCELAHNGNFLDVQKIKIKPGEGAGVQFDLKSVDAGSLSLQLDRDDQLAVDNKAFAALNLPRPAKVLLVTPLSGAALELALTTPDAAKIAEVATLKPAGLTTKTYSEQADSGAYDLIIYELCSPPKMPQANTLFIGAIPPVEKPAAAAAPAEEAEAAPPPTTTANWQRGPKQSAPQILDVDRSHPLMQYLSLDKLKIADGTVVKPPAGGAVLVDSNLAPPAGEGASREKWGLVAIAPRGSYEDAVLGFEIMSLGDDGATLHNTDWILRLSFPVFAKNVLEYLGGSHGALSTPGVQPGKPIALRSISPVERIVVTGPKGAATEVLRQGQNAFIFGETVETGIYQVREGSAQQPAQEFAVNLFDSRESNITPRAEIYPGHEVVKGQSGWEPARLDFWKWILFAALGVLLFEWYVYNRRVYL